MVANSPLFRKYSPINWGWVDHCFQKKLKINDPNNLAYFYHVENRKMLIIGIGFF